MFTTIICLFYHNIRFELVESLDFMEGLRTGYFVNQLLNVVYDQLVLDYLCIIIEA